jgi:uncharacterized protein YabN with tetrapyrrole methylase and pyrophosphatase domain
MTLEVKSVIQKCDCVVYLVNDPAMKKWIEDNSKKSISLDEVYFQFSDRKETYDFISNEILNIADNYENTCFVTYGHPLFLSDSSMQLIKKIRDLKWDINIEVLPGISSLDNLLCDLCIDPGVGGIQAYESSEFINKNYKINKNSHLILWQIGVIGIKKIINHDNELIDCIERKKALLQLKKKLMSTYDETHIIVLYVASIYPQICFERINTTLSKLDIVDIPRLATAYIPPIIAL